MEYIYDCLEILYKLLTRTILLKNTYDGRNVTSYTDRDLKTTYYTYDTMNRLEKVIYQDGSTAKYDYNGAGDVTKVTPEGKYHGSTSMTA